MMNMKFFNELLFFIVFFFLQVDALIVGSNLTGSRQTYVTFPASGTNNTMLGFASFENGFALQSHTATCTFDDFFPVSGRVDLRGGKLYLRQDLLFDKSLNLTSSGDIWANAYSVEFGSLLTDLSLSPSLLFNNTTLIFNSDANVYAPMQVRGNCKIIGRGRILRLSSTGSIIVRPGCNLVLEDVQIHGLNQNKLRCMTDSSSLTLRDCVLELDGNYTFSRGTVQIDKSVIVTGTSTFAYTAVWASTVNSYATLFFDCGTTLSYAPLVPRRTLLTLQDNSSTLYLNNCSLFSTRTGLQLSTGSVIIDGTVTFSSQARYPAEALTLQSSANVTILGGSKLDIQGVVRYD